MKRENFYRRDPSAALQGMSSMSLEERGVYNTVLDLAAVLGCPPTADPSFIGAWCGVSARRCGPILDALVTKGALAISYPGGEAVVSVVDPPVVDARPAVSAAWRQALYEAANGRCSYCRSVLTFDDPTARTHFHCDHIVPWSKGGAHSLENMAAACMACNLSKGARDLAEWIA